MVPQGSYAVIEEGEDFDRLFTHTLSPCVAIIIWDSLGSKALLAHLDHFRSIDDLIGVSRETFRESDTNNLHSFLYSVDNGKNKSEELDVLFNFSTQKEILGNFKKKIREGLGLNSDHISAKLMTPNRPLKHFGEYFPAMLSIGFDLRTKDFFVSSPMVETNKYMASQDKVQMVKAALLMAYQEKWSDLAGLGVNQQKYFNSPEKLGSLPFQKALTNEELLNLFPESHPVRNLISSHRELKKAKYTSFTKPPQSQPKKQPTAKKMTYPFPFQKFDIASTQLVAQGEFFFIKEGQKKSRLFTFPCAPCPGIVIYDTELKQAWMGHLDYLVDFHSIYTSYKLYFPFSESKNIKVVIFSAKNSDLDEDKFKELYRVESLDILLRNIKNYVEKNLGIPREQISAKLWKIAEPIRSFGKHAMAQQGLGFDLATGECFTTALLKEESQKDEFHRIWKMIIAYPLRREQSLTTMFALSTDDLFDPGRFGAVPLIRAEPLLLNQ